MKGSSGWHPQWCCKTDPFGCLWLWSRERCVRTVAGSALCAARCLKQCQLWGCCYSVRGGSRALTERVESHGRALLTQAEGKVHWTWLRSERDKPRTASNLFQGVVCEQNRDLGHGSCKPLGQGHSPLLAVRLVHPRTVDEDGNRDGWSTSWISRCVKASSRSLIKTCQTWHTDNTAKGLLPEEISVSKAEYKFTAPDYFILWMWGVLPCGWGALTVQEVAVAQRVCTEFPPSANCLR